ncbi:MAG: protein serine/threonine phosphatase [Bacteroidetes bacterium]|jgi:serine phosphatase RsbU (regulator of sigma subunit)|nr:protein serine/threonine phosphatase [Bacteroidota bacterium]MDF2452840.1 protein serine/threonine phosphatase [Bacteroidota bacterium]
MGKISQIWEGLSRNGLREEEGIMQFREVIFLNKILIISPLIIIFQIPIEIALNGFKALSLDLMFLALMLIPIFLQRFRYFWIAKLYCVIISHTFIVIAGTMVGKGINNHVTIIPLLLFGMILFKKGRDRIFVLLISTLSYFILNYLHEAITPVYDITEENKQNFTIIFYVLALIVTFLCGFYFLNINKDFEELIEKQKESLEEKNKEVKDSITYAKRIQLSILPNENQIKEIIPNSFITYIPKDIVSGDFYWTQTVKNLFFIAAADSTGHGVPGAMVSVICSNALNRSVKEFGITETGKILDKTRELILETFAKSGSDVKDGMDISLLCLDKDNQKIYWSGANNPLWYIRRTVSSEDVENNELIEIKADKQPVGKTDNPKPFTTHQLDYKTNTSFYLFTDGFADQFGGPKGKKFKYKQLAELMVNKNTKSMEEQEKTLTEAFFNWKGDLEQVDDICIIGIRI